MRNHRNARYLVVAALSFFIFGISGSNQAQEKAAPAIGSEPAGQSSPAPKIMAPKLPAAASSSTAVLTVSGVAFHPRGSATAYAYDVAGCIHASQALTTLLPQYSHPKGQ